MLQMVSWHAQETTTIPGLTLHQTPPAAGPFQLRAPKEWAAGGGREGKEWRRYASKFKITLKFPTTDWLWWDHTERRLLGSQGQAEINK